MEILLPILVLTPVAGAIALLVGYRNEAARGQRFAVIVGAAVFVLAVMLAGRGSDATKNVEGSIQPRFLFSPEWLHLQAPLGAKGASIDLQLALGADGPALALVLLTSLVTLSVLLVVPRLVKSRTTEYAAFVLLMEGALVGAFLSMDLLLFYIFFELTLLPVLALVSGWGSDGSWPAARRFMLFTLAGSLPMVVGFVALAVLAPGPAGSVTVYLPELAQLAQGSGSAVGSSFAMDLSSQRWIFILLVLGFGIKMAILPVHTWLPRTYAASHPTTAALLAAVVLKLGIFGFLRVCLPLVPLACEELARPLLGTLGAAAIVYGALAALAQRDIRLILAYSSLSHCGFITLGLFSLKSEGITGATLQMVNHGLTTAAMFLLLGMIAARRGSTKLDDGATGLATTLPRIAALFIFFTLAGAGMPGLNNFVGELLSLMGMVQASPILTAIAALGVILGAWYALRLVQRLLFGPAMGAIALGSDGNRDLRRSEFWALAPIAILCVALGVVPQRAVEFIEPDVRALAAVYTPENPVVALAERGEEVRVANSLLGGVRP